MLQEFTVVTIEISRLLRLFLPLFSYLLQHLILHDFQLFWEDVFFPVISSYKVEQQAFFLAFHLRLLFAF